MKKAVFLFNKTLAAPQPWLDAGYECWLFDGQHEKGIRRADGVIRVGMWFYAAHIEKQMDYIADLIGDGVEFVCSFAECTYLTVSGARWFYHPDDRHLPTSERRPHPLYPDRAKDRDDALVMAKMVEPLAGRLGTTCWMLENPAISSINTMWRRPDHTFDPWMMGGYLPVDDVHPEYPANYPPRDAYHKNTGIWCGEGFTFPELKPVEPVPGDFHQVTRCGGKSLRTKNIRSYTPRGFARAIFEANKR